MSDEPEYFDSPHISKLVDLVLQLAASLHVTTQRLRALEMQLVRNGAIQQGLLDEFIPTADEQRVLDDRREEFLGGLVRIITEGGPAEHPLRGQWENELAKKNRS